MKVLVKIHRSPEQRFLVSIPDKALIREVCNLIKKNKRSKAIATVLSKGRFISEVSKQDLSNVKANMIITEEYVSRDLSLPKRRCGKAVKRIEV